jgi:hypothetical protein
VTEAQRLALVREAKRHLKLTRKGWLEEPVGQGSEWKASMEALNALERDLRPDPLPDISSVTKDGASLLDMSLTHKTSGIPLFPAIDVAWGAGVSMYAPENCVVDTKDTSANPGEALYLLGESKMRYWYGHLDRDFSLGKKFAAGAFIAKTVDQVSPLRDHGHVGVNGEAFLGKGKQFKYGRDGNGPDYTLGAPTIRVQLRKVLL